MSFKGKKIFLGKPALVVVAAILALSLAVAGCGGGSDNMEDHIGYYVIDSVTINGDVYDTDAVSDAGMDYYIRLNEDGTAVIQTDMFVEGTWEVGALHYEEDGEPVSTEYVLKNDLLTLEISDDETVVVLVFKRSDDDAEIPDSSDSDDVIDSDDDDVAAPDAHFTRAELEEIYAELKVAYDGSELSGKSYKEICDTYFDGVEGHLDLEGDTIDIYKWYATDDDEAYAQVTFQDYDGDGNKTAGGIGYSFP